MPLHVQRGLALIGFGLLIGFVGLILVANLFKVVDTHARKMAATNRRHIWSGRRINQTPAEVKSDLGFKIGRYTAGAGFMIFGLLVVGGGVAYLVARPV
jgi:hypothetical protein